MTFLLIEDDEDDQEIFCMALRNIDATIECVIANDGVEALKILEDANSPVPSYIFIDVNMPKMNGIEVLQEIKKLPRVQPANVIMFSTTSEEKIIQKSKELGAVDFIIKPPSISTLTKKLAEVLHPPK